MVQGDCELTKYGFGIYLDIWHFCHDLLQLSSIPLENNHKVMHIREDQGYLNSIIGLESSCLSKCKVEILWKILVLCGTQFSEIQGSGIQI